MRKDTDTLSVLRAVWCHMFSGLHLYVIRGNVSQQKEQKKMYCNLGFESCISLLDGDMQVPLGKQQ